MKQAFGALPRVVRVWLPFAALALCTALMVYGAVQQNFRASANDPQIRMVEDAIQSLLKGMTPQAIVGSSDRLELEKTLSPFLVIYDDAGNPLAASATLHGRLPMLPGGVYDYTRTHGADRVTWQPEPGLRFATVMERYSVGQGSSTVAAGFVLAGRSLKEVEAREHRLVLNLMLGLMVTLIVTFIAVTLAAF